MNGLNHEEELARRTPRRGAALGETWTVVCELFLPLRHEDTKGDWLSDVADELVILVHLGRYFGSNLPQRTQRIQREE